MSRRILLADDSVTIQKVIELTFAEQDYEIEAVSDGTSAISRLSERRPDLVLADVHMPGASGFEVCRLAKELHPGLPVVLMVGTFEPFEEADATAAGADTYVKKPFDSQELLRLVAELMPRGAHNPAAPAEPERMGSWAMDWGVSEAGAAEPATADLPPETAVTAEAEEEVDLESWDKLEIAAAEDEDAAGEPVWGNLDDSLGEDSLGDAAFAEDEALAAEPLERPEPTFPDFSSAGDAPGEPASAAQPFEIGLEAAGEIPLPAASEAPSAAGETAWGVAPAAAVTLNGLSDEDVDRVARRVIELLGDKVVRDIAWEVIPDVAELVIKDRIRELEAQADGRDD